VKESKQVNIQKPYCDCPYNLQTWTTTASEHYHSIFMTVNFKMHANFNSWSASKSLKITRLLGKIS